MVPIMNFVALIFNIVVCFGPFIAVIIILAVKKQHCMRPLIVGAAAFCVSQLILRIPINSVFVSWTGNINETMPWVYAIISALLAGIFEEGGKYAGMRLAMKDNQRWVDGIAFGMGFAGVYTIFFSGFSHVSNLVAAITLQQEGMEQIVQRLGAQQANVYYEALVQTPFYQMALYGLYGLFTMAINVALALLILYGIQKGTKQGVVFGLAALFSHFLIEGVSMVLSSVFQASDYVVEAYMAVLAVAAVWFIFWSKSRGMFCNAQLPQKKANGFNPLLHR